MRLVEVFDIYLPDANSSSMGYNRDNKSVKFQEQRIILNRETHNNCSETWWKIGFQWKEGEYLFIKYSIATSYTGCCMIIRNISTRIHKKLRRNIHGVLNKVVNNGWRVTLAYSRYFSMYLQLLSKRVHPKPFYDPFTFWNCISLWSQSFYSVLP